MEHILEKCFKNVDRNFQDISKDFLSHRTTELTCTLECSEIRNQEAILNQNLHSKHIQENFDETEGIVVYVVIKPRVCNQLIPRSTPTSPLRKSSPHTRTRSRSQSADPYLRSAPNLCYHRQYNLDQKRTRRLRCSHSRFV